MDTSFGFNVEIRLGAGAFVCGEETALIASVEGRRGTPRPRPPYPAVEGLWGKPTLINNVEIVRQRAYHPARGAGEVRLHRHRQVQGHQGLRPGRSSVVNTGLVEVPMGMTLREIIYDIGGGITGDRPFKAVQTGGPSGGCIPAAHLDTPVATSRSSSWARSWAPAA